jgi:predicted metal-dependent hydrolase
MMRRLPDHVEPACCAGPPPAALRHGIDEFNAGLYFEAHETLEAIWMAEPRDTRLLYQGILQVGVGLYHLRRQNYRGAINLLAYGLDKLSRLPSPCLGVDVADLMAAAGACRARVLALGPGRLADFDWQSAPTIRFAPAAATPSPSKAISL